MLKMTISTMLYYETDAITTAMMKTKMSNEPNTNNQELSRQSSDWSLLIIYSLPGYFLTLYMGVTQQGAVLVLQGC